MHISRERQREKLQERIDVPSKNWKHNAADWDEAKRWDEYIEAYEYAINESRIPWIIAPSDQRWYRDYFIAEKIVDVLRGFKMSLPLLTEAEKNVGG